MEEQRLDGDVTSDEIPVPGMNERRQYVRPELVQYGALQEVTRAYTQTRSCAGATCANA